jgi:hypothetical protein
VTPLEAAQKIAEKGPYTYDQGGLWCLFCDAESINPHASDCPWLMMPQIIAALEAAERLSTALGPLEVDVSGMVHVEEDLIWGLQRAMEGDANEIIRSIDDGPAGES